MCALTMLDTVAVSPHLALCSEMAGYVSAGVPPVGVPVLHPRDGYHWWCPACGRIERPYGLHYTQIALAPHKPPMVGCRCGWPQMLLWCEQDYAEVCEWLTYYLADAGGARRKSSVMAAAERVGFNPAYVMWVAERLDFCLEDRMSLPADHPWREDPTAQVGWAD